MVGDASTIPKHEAFVIHGCFLALNFAVVIYDDCCGFLESNGHRGTQSEVTVSSSNDHEESSRGKPKLQAIRKFIDPTKFRNSLKKRRSSSLNRVKNLQLPVVDVRDAKDQKAVDELRRELLFKNLLPPQYDDYHVLLRFVFNDLFPGKLPSNAISVAQVLHVVECVT